MLMGLGIAQWAMVMLLVSDQPQLEIKLRAKYLLHDKKGSTENRLKHNQNTEQHEAIYD
jgi:hypothetical protein